MFVWQLKRANFKAQFKRQYWKEITKSGEFPKNYFQYYYMFCLAGNLI